MGNKHGGKKKKDRAGSTGSNTSEPRGPDAKITDYYTEPKGVALGKGHFAVVRKMVQIETGREVAVKVIKRKDMSADKVEQEVEILKQAGKHPAVVELLDVFYDKKEIMLVMELLSGGELFDRLSEEGPYTEAEAAVHVKSIASALKYLHSIGVIHRDLKPENLILVDKTADSALRVCDFGLSKLMDADSDVVEADQVKTICGTWAYQAPEVKALNGKYDESIDMWALGVIMFVVLAAYHPFDVMGDATDEEIIRHARDGDWSFEDPEGDAWATISESAQDLISNLVVVDPTKRFSAQQVLDHPWVTPPAASVRPARRLGGKRGSTVDVRMANFQSKTKLKFKGAVRMVMAANSIKNMGQAAAERDNKK